MIPSFATAGILTAPLAALQLNGYVPGNTLAAQHLNWYLGHLTLELNNLLTAGAVAQNSAVDTQVATAVQNIAGAVATPVTDLGTRLPLGVPTPIMESMLAATGTGRHASRSTTSTSAGHIVDSGATFTTDGVQVGDYAYNFTDGTAAKITVVNSQTDCSVDNDVFPTGKSYRIFPNITLPANVKRCDGSTISDAQSPFNGLKLPNLNGAGAFADNAVSGGRFLRGGTTAGVEMEDQEQGHWHSLTFGATAAWPNNNIGPGTGVSGTGATSGQTIVTDGTNGTPRTGKESRGRSISMVYVMRIK